MTAVPRVSPAAEAVAAPRPFLVGVHVGPDLIRAGVFSETFELIGKAKLSTKPGRGPAAILERVARCVEYAADECDLRVEDIRAVGAGLPGIVDPDRGLAVSAGSLGWKDVPVRSALEKLLRMPVFVENQFRLGTLGVFAREINFPTKRVAVLFLGPEIGGGFVTDGKLADAEPPGNAGTRGPGFDGVFATVCHAEFRQAGIRDLRKAIRKRNVPAREFARTIASKAGEISAWILKWFAPDVIALGGGLVEDMRDEALAIVERATVGEAHSSRVSPVRFCSSSLGELAGLAGGATLAADRLATLV